VTDSGQVLFSQGTFGSTKYFFYKSVLAQDKYNVFVIKISQLVLTKVDNVF